MEILEKLTSTESYFIKENEGSTYKELLKLTLADLCLKKILKIEDKEIQSHPSNPVRILKYVSAGRNFEGYRPRAHELPFLSPFLKNADIDILFNQMVKLAYQNGGGRRRFINKILLKDPEIIILFNRDFLTRLFGEIALNEKGKNTKTQITEALAYLETQLPQLIQNDKKSALDKLKKIGGNVFLISGLEFEFLKEIDEALAAEYERNMDNAAYGCAGCVTSYSDHSGSFDGAFDSADSSGSDSGCSGGDSGCSGCSGCGGCGGCG